MKKFLVQTRSTDKDGDFIEHTIDADLFTSECGVEFYLNGELIAYFYRVNFVKEVK